MTVPLHLVLQGRCLDHEPRGAAGVDAAAVGGQAAPESEQVQGQGGGGGLGDALDDRLGPDVSRLPQRGEGSAQEEERQGGGQPIDKR